MSSDRTHDVAIVGGGPAGSTVGTMLKKYKPDLRVVILERERFPRDHIGESQLPAIGSILHEMGVWEKVEQAGFPIKLGATFTWGRDEESWDLDFYPVEEFHDEPRPASFEGQRLATAFQVGRAEYDTILLEHAESLGVEVRQETRVSEVLRHGDLVDGLRLEEGATITAEQYVDATGNVGLLRRALGVEVDAPKELRNVAFWDYWENAEWAVKIGVGGTRIQIRSLPYGWLWFIPLGPTTTSIGLVCPASYYASTGKSATDLYREAVASDPHVSKLIAGATSRGTVETTRDWSHLSDRVSGPNWFIVGEAAGFADPILSAGMTLAHSSGREAAYVMLEIARGADDADVLRRWYNDKTRANIRQHIRFAQFWYASNGCFTELKSHCQAIAREAGVRLRPEQAWRWLAQGGFANQVSNQARYGSFDIGCAKTLLEKFTGREQEYEFTKFSSLKVNLRGAIEEPFIGELADGQIERTVCYRRGQHLLPMTGVFRTMVEVVRKQPRVTGLYEVMRQSIRGMPNATAARVLGNHFQALEAMILEGWITGKTDARHQPRGPKSGAGRLIRSTEAGLEALRKRDEAQQEAGDS